MKRATLLSLAAASLILACQSDRPLEPKPKPSGISADFSDGRVAGGNPHFFFLPPLVSQPTFSGTFNPNLRPVVDICQLVVDANANPLACDQTAPEINPGTVQLDLSDQQYRVNWHTDQPAVDLRKFYRIQVRGAPGAKRVLGFADIAPVANGSQLKTVNTGQYIGLVVGRTLPIKVRIENGAFCPTQADCGEATVGPNPTAEVDVVTPSKLAAAAFPPGYFTQTVILTIARVAEGCFNASSPAPSFQAFGCYSFSTDPSVGDALHCQASPSDPTKCARVEVCPTLLPTDPGYHHLQLTKSDAGQPATVLPEATATLITNCTPWVPPIGLRAPGIVDLARARWRSIMHAVGRLVKPTPLFGATAVIHDGLGGLTCCFSNIGWALPLSMRPVPGTDNLTGVSGAPVAPHPTVLVQYLHPTVTAALGIPVSFGVQGGGGTVSGATQVTGETGTASVGSWTLGTADGLNTLVATAPGVARVSFAATGVTISTTVTELCCDAVPTGAPDLVSATATAGGGNLMLSVHFATETFNSATTHVVVNLDSDRNPSTGFPGVDAGNRDRTIMGTDFLIAMGSTSEGGTAKLLRFVALPNSFSPVASVPVAVLADGLSMTVPLAALANNDGQMNFKVTVQTQQPSSACPPGFTVCYTGIQDYLPNVGLAAGMLHLPLP